MSAKFAFWDKLLIKPLGKVGKILCRKEYASRPYGGVPETEYLLFYINNENREVQTWFKESDLEKK